jgi:hypothetical protein
MQLKSRSTYTLYLYMLLLPWKYASISTHIHPPIYSASTLEVRIHIYSIQIHPKIVLLLYWEWTVQKYSYYPFYPLLANKAPNIQLCHLMLLCSKRGLGILKKEKKEDKCPTQNKERFSSPSFPQSFQVSKRGIWNFSKGAKYSPSSFSIYVSLSQKELSIHHRHSLYMSFLKRS